MAGSVIGIAGSGLNAQGGPPVVGHDGVNSRADGARRPHAANDIQAPPETEPTVAGDDATADAVRRAYGRFLDDSVLHAQAQSARLGACHTGLRRIRDLLTVPESSLSPALRSFFSGVQDVASHAASLPARQQLNGLAQALVTGFHSLGAHLADMRPALNREMSDIVSEINSLAEELAGINEQILRSGASGRGQLEDLVQRGELQVGRLSALASVSAVRQSDASLDVSIAGGHNLVLAERCFRLAAAPSAEDPQDYAVFHLSGAVPTALDAAGLQGGRLCGLLAFRGETLDAAQNQLGRIAIVLAHTFNDQHRMGADLQGDLGRGFFGVPLAAVVGKQGNTGTALVAAENSNVGALTASDYRLRLDAGVWTLIRLTDNTQTLFTGFPQTVDGVTLTLISGAAADGDSFLIRPTRNGARDIECLSTDPARIAAAAPGRQDPNGIYDNRNALPLAALHTRSTIGNGTASYLGAYDRMVEEIGGRAHAIEAQGRAHDALLEQARATRQSLPEADLAEEAATLIRRQHAYQASGKAVQAAAQLFDSILELA
ncbi:MAG TPA: flagellar hook-associated protein FlgK [Burkholderiales bacterium]|nr:flagellar hook-associated protein FlgK [Burkholderiales bacterium]